MENQFQKLSIFATRQANRMSVGRRQEPRAGSDQRRLGEAQKLMGKRRLANRQLIDYGNLRPRFGGSEKYIETS